VDGLEAARQVAGARPGRLAPAESAVPTDPLVSELDRLAERYDLLDPELAAVLGVSPTTIRYLRATGRRPHARATIRAIELGIARAKTATRRSELTLAAHPLRRGAR